MKKLNKKEFAEFRRLVNGVNERGFDNANRVISRVSMTKFIEEHGREACDEAFKRIEDRSRA
jgi:hypothetical protein